MATKTKSRTLLGFFKEILIQADNIGENPENTIRSSELDAEIKKALLRKVKAEEIYNAPKKKAGGFSTAKPVKSENISRILNSEKNDKNKAQKKNEGREIAD